MAIKVVVIIEIKMVVELVFCKMKTEAGCKQENTFQIDIIEKEKLVVFRYVSLI